MYKQPMYDIETGCIIILDSWQWTCYWGTAKKTWYPISNKAGWTILRYHSELIEKMDKGILWIIIDKVFYNKSDAVKKLSPNNIANEKE